MVEITKVKQRRYYPMIVSENGTEDKISSELYDAIWGKFDSLPTQKQDALTSYEIANQLVELQKKFLLSDNIIGMVSLLVRKLFFGELDLAGAEAKIGSLLTQTPGGDPNKAKDIVAFIDREILHLVPKPVIEAVKSVEQPKATGAIKKPLLSALAEYPRLGDQNITANRIKTKQAPEPVRGSLTNWIHYYRDELGIGFHDQVKRGQFLFQSENGKRLSGEERERLNLILKSIEEEFPLDIDTDRQLIVFPLGSPELQHQSPQTPKGATEPLQSPKGVSQPQSFVVPKGMSRPGRSTVPSQSASWAIPKPAIAFNYGRPVAASSQVNPSQVPKQVDGKSRFMEVNSKPAENIADATLRFSTGHVLPSEKAAPSVLKPQNFASPQSGTVAPAQSVGISNTPKPISGGDQRIVTPVQNTQRSPYSIHPLRPRS